MYEADLGKIDVSLFDKLFQEKSTRNLLYQRTFVCISFVRTYVDTFHYVEMKRVSIFFEKWSASKRSKSRVKLRA